MSRTDLQPLDVAQIPRLALREPEAAQALGVSASWLRREAIGIVVALTDNHASVGEEGNCETTD